MLKICLCFISGLIYISAAYANNPLPPNCGNVRVYNDGAHALQVTLSFPNTTHEQSISLSPSAQQILALEAFIDCNEGHPDSKIRCNAIVRKCYQQAFLNITNGYTQQILFSETIQPNQTIHCWHDACELETTR